MKHKIIALVAMAFCAAGARAQGIEIRDVFRQMPDTVVPYLSQNNRLDLVDFVDALAATPCLKSSAPTI